VSGGTAAGRARTELHRLAGATGDASAAVWLVGAESGEAADGAAGAERADGAEGTGARGRGLPAVHVVDPDDDRWLDAVRGVSAGVVVVDGLLETARSPEEFLRSLTTTGVLAADGRLVLDVRNAASRTVVAELAADGTGSGSDGVLGRGRRTWFSLPTVRDTLEAAGYVVEEVHRVRDHAGHPAAGPGPVAERALDALHAAAGDDRQPPSEWDVETHVLVARPSGAAARITELARRLEATDAAAVELRARAAVAADRLAAAQALLADERAEHARLVEDGRRDLVALRTANAELTRRVGSAAAELAAAKVAAAGLRSGRAYRTGEAVLRAATPVRVVRRRVRRGLRGVLRRLR